MGKAKIIHDVHDIPVPFSQTRSLVAFFFICTFELLIHHTIPR
jgi:hypothetical protein